MGSPPSPLRTSLLPGRIHSGLVLMLHVGRCGQACGWLFPVAWAGGQKARSEVQRWEVHRDHISKPHPPVQFLSAQSSYFDLYLPDFIVYLSVISKLGRKSVIYGAMSHLDCRGIHVSHIVVIWIVFIVMHLDWIHGQHTVSGVMGVVSPLAAMQRAAFY